MKNNRWHKQLIHGLIVAMVAVGLVGCWPQGSAAINANQGAEMDKVKVMVSVDDAHIDQIDQVVDQLKVAGLDVEQTLSTLGLVSGLVETEKMSSLSEVTGVESVQIDQPHQLAPPGSEVQ